MKKNLTSVLVVLAVVGVGFGVYWFALRTAEEACTDCGDTTDPALQKYRGEFPVGKDPSQLEPTPTKGINLPPRTPPSIRPNVEKML
jgi:hypothetical protein